MHELSIISSVLEQLEELRKQQRGAHLSKLGLRVGELAGVDVFCSDKTGTLTKNEMRVAEPVVLGGHDERELFLVAALASRPENRDPIELPIFDYAQEHFPDLDWKGYQQAAFSPFDPVRKRTEAQIERWVRDFDGWSVCDGCCLYLFTYVPFAWRKIFEWSRRPREFEKRAAFSLVACLTVHDKTAPNEKFLKCLPLVKRAATDERNFVRKAVNWALRQIGKRNRRLNREAIRTAEKMRRLDSRSARWIAADALRELKSVAVQRRLKS